MFRTAVIHYINFSKIINLKENGGFAIKTFRNLLLFFLFFGRS